jgi:hypothetical protein
MYEMRVMLCCGLGRGQSDCVSGTLPEDVRRVSTKETRHQPDGRPTTIGVRPVARLYV